MRVSIANTDTYNQSMEIQQNPERKATPIKSIDSNHQKSKNHDIIKRKKEGEVLSKSEEKMIAMIEKSNKFLLKPPTELRFSIHEKTKRINIKIINTESQEIIKEIPSEKVLDMIAKMWELAGLFVDEKA